MGKTSLHRLATWPTGRGDHGKAEPCKNRSGEGEQRGEASRGEVEEWHLAVIVPTIYKAR